MQRTTVGNRIKARRLELGLTQIQLAQKMGYRSKAAISSVENGKEDLTTERVVKYADALNCTPQYLMGWTQEVIDRISDGLEELGRENMNLTFRERKLIDGFRKLDDSNKEVLEGTLDAMLAVLEKKEEAGNAA